MNPWITPVSFLAGGIIFGWILEKIVLSIMRRIARKTRWKADQIVVESMKGLPFFWLILGGLYGMVLTSPITAGQLRIVEKILLILLTLSVTIALIRIASATISHHSTGAEGTLPSASILSTLATIFIVILGILTVLQSLGISVAPALAALGIGGIAIALALQDPLTNLFSGLQILASGQISPGDYIRLSTGEEGYIADITWRNTTIRTLTNNIVLIPNSQMSQNIITNFHKPDKQLALLVDVSISYSSDLQKVERITREVGEAVMNSVEGAVPGFTPVIRWQMFGDFSIPLTVVLRCEEYSFQGPVRTEFIRRLHARFQQENIEIPFPPVGISAGK